MKETNAEMKFCQAAILNSIHKITNTKKGELISKLLLRSNDSSVLRAIYKHCAFVRWWYVFDWPSNGEDKGVVSLPYYVKDI